MDKPSKLVQELVLYSIVLAAAGWVIYTYQVLFGPLIIAGLIAYLLQPPVNWIAARGKIRPRQVVPYIYTAFIIFMVWAIIYLIPILTKQTSLLSEQLLRLPGQLTSLQARLDDLIGFHLPLDRYAADLEMAVAQLAQPARIFRVLQEASTNIVWIIIIVITSFHLLRDWDKLREWLFALSPPVIEPDLRRLHQEIKLVWQAYLRGQLLIMTILGILSGLGAALVGIPGALVLGLLAGTLALIPSLGPAVATIIAAVVAWLQGSSYLNISNAGATLIIVALFQGIQLFEGFWLTPRIMARRLNLHPGLVLIAIVSTLFTLGAVMALIIVPVIGSLDVIFQYTRRVRAGLAPWPEPEQPTEDFSGSS